MVCSLKTKATHKLLWTLWFDEKVWNWYHTKKKWNLQLVYVRYLSLYIMYLSGRITEIASSHYGHISSALSHLTNTCYMWGQCHGQAGSNFYFYIRFCPKRKIDSFFYLFSKWCHLRKLHFKVFMMYFMVFLILVLLHSLWKQKSH